MKKFFAFVNQNSRLLLWVCIGLVLFPFITLSVFNHPASDDYCYTNFIRDHEFWEAQIKHYYVWTGRFTATFLLTIDPINPHDLAAYKVLPVILLLSFVLAVFVLIKSLIPSLSSFNQLLLSGLILFLYLYYLPNTAEAFYWRAGSVTYQFASFLSLLLFASIRQLQLQKSAVKKLLFTVLACFLTIVTIGLNETSMIINLVIVVLWSVGWFIFRREKKLEMGAILLFTVLAAAFVILAPGNAVRMAEKPHRFQLLFSLIGSLEMTLKSILRWVPMTVLVIALFSPLFGKAAKTLRTQFSFQWIRLWHVIFSGLFLFGFLVVCFFPSFWSQGGRPPFRTVNVIYLLFILGVFILYILFVIYLQEKNQSVPSLRPGDSLALVVIALGLIIFKPNNIAEAYSDLLSGTAHRYHLEMESRYRLLENCSEKNCVVPALKHQPVTILSSDLSADPSRELYYYNICLASFFNISDVIIPGNSEARNISAKVED